MATSLRTAERWRRRNITEPYSEVKAHRGNTLRIQPGSKTSACRRLTDVHLTNLIRTRAAAALNAPTRDRGNPTIAAAIASVLRACALHQPQRARPPSSLASGRAL